MMEFEEEKEEEMVETEEDEDVLIIVKSSQLGNSVPPAFASKDFYSIPTPGFGGVGSGDFGVEDEIDRAIRLGDDLDDESALAELFDGRGPNTSGGFALPEGTGSGGSKHTMGE